jgi:hypothetical protein
MSAIVFFILILMGNQYYEKIAYNIVAVFNYLENIPYRQIVNWSLCISI